MSTTYLGKRCINGHDGLRYTRSRLCVECKREQNLRQAQRARQPAERAPAPRRDTGTGGLSPHTANSRRTGLELMGLIAGVRVELRP